MGGEKRIGHPAKPASNHQTSARRRGSNPHVRHSLRHTFVSRTLRNTIGTVARAIYGVLESLKGERLIGRQSSILIDPFSPLHHQCVA